jgi:hypothetical protein
LQQFKKRRRHPRRVGAQPLSEETVEGKDDHRCSSLLDLRSRATRRDCAGIHTPMCDGADRAGRGVGRATVNAHPKPRRPRSWCRGLRGVSSDHPNM